MKSIIFYLHILRRKFEGYVWIIVICVSVLQNMHTFMIIESLSRVLNQHWLTYSHTTKSWPDRAGEEDESPRAT